MFDKCLIEELQHLFALEASIKEDWEEWESWGTATDVRIIQTALKRCTEYLKKDISKEYNDALRMQLITSKTESSTMTKPIGLSCDFEVPTGQAALDSEITSPSLRD